jgi:hypothetical protein
MPTPRAHGGAALQHIPLANPGFKGLNTEQASGLLGPEWATKLQNAVIDPNNRLAARKGWTDQTTTPAGAVDFISGFEHYQADGTTELHLATATAIYRSVDEGVSFTAVTGTASFTDGNWQFLNFADRVVGIQAGEAPIAYSGTTYSHIVDVNVPTGGAGTAFGGRLWIADADGTTLKYSALLDETDWTSADSGAFNFQNVWGDTDTITAVAAHNNLLVVFGERNIILLTDAAGSSLGIDPINTYVLDVIKGTGCAARDSVQNVEGDLWFLSRSGLMSLGRLIQERSNPLDNISKNVATELLDSFNDAGFTQSDLRSVYSPKDRFYLLSLPKASGSTEVGKTWCFDTRGRLEDGSFRCLGCWDGDLVPRVLIRRNNNDILSANRLNQGELFKYDGFTDDTASYGLVYESGWGDLGAPGIIKILKRFSGIFFADQEVTVGFKWAWNFEETFTTRTKTFPGAADDAVWGESLWGTGLWGGGVKLRDGKTVPSGTGEYIKWGITVTISGQQFSIQQLELFAKLGRLG